MQNEKPIQAERPDEGRRHDAVQERFAKVQAIARRIRPLDLVDEGRLAVDAQPDLFAPFQEDAFGSGSVEAEEPLEIAALIRQVVIEGSAQPHRHVGGFVALHAESRLDHVNGKGCRQRDDQEDGADERGGARRHAAHDN